MAGEAQSINAKVSVSGKSEGRGFKKQMTFEMISQWIKLQGFDEYTTKGLIKLASRYPTQALPKFKDNFNLMIQRVRQERKKEMGQLLINQKEGNDDKNKSEIRDGSREQHSDSEIAEASNDDRATIIDAEQTHNGD